jgi:hypothetical protein
LTKSLTSSLEFGSTGQLSELVLNRVEGNKDAGVPVLGGGGVAVVGVVTGAAVVVTWAVVGVVTGAAVVMTGGAVVVTRAVVAVVTGAAVVVTRAVVVVG